MLISHIAEENEKNGAYVEEMDVSEGDDITSRQRDLLILYENDVKQTAVSMGTIYRMPNQHVENVVYKDDEESEDSDVSDIYRGEDLYDVVMINKERIDLLNSVPSVEKSLRQKFGDIAIQSGFQSNYHNDLLKNPYAKSQIRSLDNITNYNAFDGTLLSTCLLDFICYNQLEDNSNFYMDSIIQYAKRTIDQLKRISNGDYLTDKAKEQWKIIDNECKSKNDDPNSKAIMAKCRKFYVNSDKTREFENTLRGLVHSELDMRSLSKILEKQLFIRIPRLMRNSYKFFGKFCDNDVIIECKEVKQRGLQDKSKSRVDILIKLESSKLGELDSGSFSLLNFKQPLLCLKNEPLTPEKSKDLLESTTDIMSMQNNVTITELKECDIEGSGDNLKSGVSCAIKPFKTESSDTDNSSSVYISDISLLTDTASNGDVQSFTTDVATIATSASCTMTPDDLFCSIQQFNTQSVLIEENEDMPLIKKKSPTKVRIKSPYENKTFAIEERKRRKLLEIRERRERRKKALSENCKVTKHRYGKGAIMAQASNSVTKLSITNKSFYTSIYGDTADLVNKHDKRRSIISDICIDRPEKQDFENKENKMFVNRSYYLDDPETEVMNIRNKTSSGNNDKDISTPSSTDIVNDINMKLNSFARLERRSSTSSMEDSSLENKKHDTDSSKPKYGPFSDLTLDASTSKSLNNTFEKKEQISIECKKSIDKIYELMKRLNSVDSESTCSKREFPESNVKQYQTAAQSSILRATDSGTSVKHRLKSSNPSLYSFEDQCNVEAPLTQSIATDRSEPEPNVISKVIISNKSQTTSNYKESKPTKKVTIKPPANISKNPLKAISHLINEFDNIQRSRQKLATEINSKDHKKTNKAVVETKNVVRQTFLKRSSNVDSSTKDIKSEFRKSYPGTDRKWQPKSPVKGGKVVNPATNFDRNNDRETKISDMIEDAMREARGEAVKGPKLNPRLESLAQPKRSLVHGQEELKIKNKKHSPFDRTPHMSIRNSLIPERTVVSPVSYSKARQRRNEMEYVNAAKTQNYLPSTDKQMRIRRLQQTPNNVPTNNAPVQHFSRLPKKITSNDVYIKKRPVILTQTAGSSNLLQKSQTLHVVPPENLQTKDSALPIPIKKIENIESRFSNNSLREKNLKNPEKVQMKEPENDSETKTNLISINHNEINSTSSDYVFDVLEDKNVLTAVENICTLNDESKKDQTEEISSNVSSISNIEKYNEITTEGIKNLEKALYQQLSQGVFLNRPKFKSLTLTPKQSHKVFLLQCGDANSLLIKSCVSQNQPLNNDQCLAKPSFELKFPLLPKPHIDRIFSRTSANITTIGCVFPNSRSIEYNPNRHDTPEQKSNTLTSDKDSSNKSNFEKGVQALLLDKNTNDKDFDSIIIKKTNKHKIDKGTEWDRSFVCNINGNSEGSNSIENESIDNTTSLDVLTELMEEIEKITKYQSVPAKNDKMEYNPLCYTSNNCVSHNPTSCLVNDNIFNAPLINIGGKMNVDNDEPAKYVDKEVAVYITKESVHVCTDAPSQLWFPKERCEHTRSNVTVGQRSSHSLVSLYDYRALYSDKFKDISDISVTYSKTKNNANSAEDYKKFARKSVMGLGQEKWDRKDLIKSEKDQNDCNAVLIMKRDILVTVYSILVFTVFAALSFPNILYNI